jgi:hypothetical protein
MTCTPGFLREEAVRQIIGAIHQGHLAGAWSLESAATEDGFTTLTFAVGTVYPDKPDTRQRVRVKVWERDLADVDMTGITMRRCVCGAVLALRSDLPPDYPQSCPRCGMDVDLCCPDCIQRCTGSCMLCHNRPGRASGLPATGA